LVFGFTGFKPKPKPAPNHDHGLLVSWFETKPSTSLILTSPYLWNEKSEVDLRDIHHRNPGLSGSAENGFLGNSLGESQRPVWQPLPSFFSPSTSRAVIGLKLII
jgi:hypothetical protein